jgi:hypothetical protein
MLKPSWKIRRRIVVSTLIFCAFCVLWIMIRGDARSVNEVIVMCAFGLAGSTIGAYVFGAVWDDRNVMKEIGPRAYENAQPPFPPGDPQ